MKTFLQKLYTKSLLILTIIVGSIYSCHATNNNSDFCSLTKPGAILIQREVKAMTDCYVEYAKKWGTIYRNSEQFKYYHVHLWFSTGDSTYYKIMVSGDDKASLVFDKEYIDYYVPTQQPPSISITDEENFGKGRIYLPLNKLVTIKPLYYENLFGWDTSQIIMTFTNHELAKVEVYCLDPLADIFLGESVLSEYLLPHTRLIVHYYCE